MHFRGCGNAVAFCIFAPAVAQLVYLRHTQGEAEVQTNAAPAVAQLVYLRQARGDAEAPKTGLVVRPGKPYALSEMPFVCLMHFRVGGNAHTLRNDCYMRYGRDRFRG